MISSFVFLWISECANVSVFASVCFLFFFLDSFSIYFIVLSFSGLFSFVLSFFLLGIFFLMSENKTSVNLGGGGSREIRGIKIVIRTYYMENIFLI